MKVPFRQAVLGLSENTELCYSNKVLSGGLPGTLAPLLHDGISDTSTPPRNVFNTVYGEESFDVITVSHVLEQHKSQQR
jgi:hypothetical protein